MHITVGCFDKNGQQWLLLYLIKTKPNRKRKNREFRSHFIFFISYNIFEWVSNPQRICLCTLHIHTQRETLQTLNRLQVYEIYLFSHLAKNNLHIFQSEWKLLPFYRKPSSNKSNQKFYFFIKSNMIFAHTTKPLSHCFWAQIKKWKRTKEKNCFNEQKKRQQRFCV